MAAAPINMQGPIDLDTLATKHGGTAIDVGTIPTELNLDALAAKHGGHEDIPETTVGPKSLAETLLPTMTSILSSISSIPQKTEDTLKAIKEHLPVIGGIGGGLLEGPPGAYLGGAGGQALKQLIDKWSGAPQPGNTLSDIHDIAQAGGINALLDAGGRIPGELIKGAKLAPRLYKAAFNPTMKEAAKGVLKTGMEEGIPAGFNVLDKLESIKAPINDAIDSLVAKHAGATIPRSQIENSVLNEMIDRYASNESRLSGASDTSFLDKLKPVFDELHTYPKYIPIEKARRMATYFQSGIGTKYGELSDIATEATKTTARHLRDAMEVVEPELKDLHGRITKLADFEGMAKRVDFQGKNSDILHSLAARLLMGSVLGGGLGASTAYFRGDPWLRQEAIAGAVLGGVAASPWAKSQLGLMLNRLPMSETGAVLTKGGYSIANLPYLRGDNSDK